MYKYLVVALLLVACGSEEPAVVDPAAVCHDEFEECLDWALLAFEDPDRRISIWELSRMFAYCEEEYSTCMGIDRADMPDYDVELLDLDTKVTFRD